MPLYKNGISTGPSFQSECEHAADLVDTLIQNMANLPIPPQIGQQLLAKAMKMKNVGPMGDEIADLLAPPDPNNFPPQAQAIVQQLQGQIQQLGQRESRMSPASRMIRWPSTSRAEAPFRQ